MQASGFPEALPVISLFLSSKTSKRVGILSCNILHEVWFPCCDRTFCGAQILVAFERKLSQMRLLLSFFSHFAQLMSGRTGNWSQMGCCRFILTGSFYSVFTPWEDPNFISSHCSEFPIRAKESARGVPADGTWARCMRQRLNPAIQNATFAKEDDIWGPPPAMFWIWSLLWTFVAATCL